MSSIVKVVGVRFKRAGKVYYFDPGELELAKGVQVIVETARGIEFGETSGPVKEVTEEELTTPLKKVIRVATDADAAQLVENQRREKEAFDVATRKIAEHNPEMDLVDVEYTFDGNKIIFYFTAEGRVDFRELVRDLAAVFRTRIELRQIGVRDEAKMLGGIGPCGRALCCTTFLGDFAPVSIKMAKEQNLSLNPTKISGLCGRLLCCLRYESEHYERAKAAFPTVGTPVSTKDGDGRVAAVNVIKGVISVEYPTGVTHDYPVDAVRAPARPGAPVAVEAAGETGPAQEPANAANDSDESATPVPQAPCQVCADATDCPRVAADTDALVEDAELVAEAVPDEGEPPVVTVFSQPEPAVAAGEPAPEAPVAPGPAPVRPGPRQRRDNFRRHNRPGANRGEHHQPGSGASTGNGNGERKQQPGAQRDGSRQNGNSSRHNSNRPAGDRRRNDGRQQRPSGRPEPRRRDDGHSGTAGEPPRRPE